ncbi:PKD domain-containing protein [Halostella salina]|uniref:PKD domain-containing protein n=1 Tax=Halostella salina TaxID=1547897 RepID=UPI000EF760FF|nr:PKD domain-containing protein [Halostella salina]
MRRVVVLAVVASLLAVPVAAATVPISLSASHPGETTPGSTVAVTLSVTNDGDQPSDAMGVQVEDVPEALTVAEIRSPNGSVAANRNAVFWTDPVPAGETVTATYVVAVDGDAPAETYEFTARAASGDSEVQQAVTVDVVPPNQPPEASVDAPSEATVGEPVTFDGSGSSDPDGTVASYEWDLDGDGEYEATGPTVEHSFDEPGERAVELQVTDDDGAVAMVVRDVQVREAQDGGNDGDGSDDTENASAAAVASDGSPFDLENAPILLGAVAVALVVLFVGWYLVRGGDDGDDAAPADDTGPGGADGPSEFGEPQPSSDGAPPSDQPPPRERTGHEQGAANDGPPGAGPAEGGAPVSGGAGRAARNEPDRPAHGEPNRPARDAPDRAVRDEAGRPGEPAEREPPRQPGGEGSGTEPRRNPEHDRARDDPGRPNSDPDPPTDDAGGDPAAGDGTDGDPAGGTEPEGTIESPAYCPHCGAAIAEYDLPTLEFCPDCGSDLQE